MVRLHELLHNPIEAKVSLSDYDSDRQINKFIDGTRHLTQDLVKQQCTDPNWLLIASVIQQSSPLSPENKNKLADLITGISVENVVEWPYLLHLFLTTAAPLPEEKDKKAVKRGKVSSAFDWPSWQSAILLKYGEILSMPDLTRILENSADIDCLVSMITLDVAMVFESADAIKYKECKRAGFNLLSMAVSAFKHDKGKSVANSRSNQDYSATLA